MREIKFRGKSKLSNNWFYGYLVNIKEPQITYYDDLQKQQIMEPVFPESVGQYTGMKDKNGKEIYDGDIVKNISEEGYPIRGLVFYDDGSFKVTSSHADITEKNVYDILDKKLIEDNNMEKIGNKYENSELLEGDEDETT